MPDLYTLRMWVVAAFAAYGAWTLGRQLLAWSRDDLDSIDRQERVKRSLSDVTRGRRS